MATMILCPLASTLPSTDGIFQIFMILMHHMSEKHRVDAP